MSDWDLSPYDPAFGMRKEFGEIARQTGRDLNRRSMAQITGAENLLGKAMADIIAGESPRANHLIARTAAMPYDPREEGSPGIRGASMLVYTLISDRFEESPEDDSEWLDIALQVHALLDGPGKAEVASIVHGFVLQKDLFQLTSLEQRRISSTVGDAPLEAELGDTQGLTAEGRHEIIRSLVEAAVALQRRYDSSSRNHPKPVD